jgi:rhamnose utilization protein RhaD (predicted bifunctional aldolase and dehydrogenase)
MISRRTWFSLGIGLVSLTLLPKGLDAQCLPPDDESASLLTYAETLAVSTDPEVVATRTAYDIPAVPVSEVELITDTQTCKQAAREYKNEVGASGKAAPVHVVRIGTRYIVVDPDERGTAESEFVLHVVFDSQFNVLARFAG